MQICEAIFRQARKRRRGVLEARKEELTQNGGNIDRKDAFLLVSTGPNTAGECEQTLCPHPLNVLSIDRFCSHSSSCCHLASQKNPGWTHEADADND